MDVIERRLKVARWEIEQADMYHYWMVNDDLKRGIPDPEIHSGGRKTKKPQAREDSTVLIEDFIEHLRKELNYSEHTLRNYRKDLMDFFNEVGKNPASVTSYDVSRFVSALSKKGLSPRSISRKLSSVRTFYRYLKKIQLVQDNPAKAVNNPKTGKPLPSYLSQEEVETLLNAASTPLEKAIVELLYATGMRISELCSLNIQDIDLKNMQIRVMGKGKKERIVYFGERAKDALLNYLKTERSQIATKLKKDQEALFVTKRGRISDMTVRRILKRIALKAGIHKNVLPSPFETHLCNSSPGRRDEP